MNRDGNATTWILPALMLAVACTCPACSLGHPDQPEKGPYEAAASLAQAPSVASSPAAVSAKGHGESGPESVVIDRLENRYGPCRFDHESHADMVSMGDGCSFCHHHSKAGSFPACRCCHGGPVCVETAGGLGLKGAYHARCMDCHSQCGVSIRCASCHEPKGDTPVTGAGMPGARPVLAKDTIVYDTPRCKGTRVAFRHDGHVERVEGGCATCHADTSCAECHRSDFERPARERGEDPHLRCVSCHGKDTDLEFECSDCHGK